MPLEERVDHEQGETLSGIAGLVKKQQLSLFSKEYTIQSFHGRTLFFSKMHIKNPHTVETLPLTGASKKKHSAYSWSQMQSFHYSLRCALWGSLT